MGCDDVPRYHESEIRQHRQKLADKRNAYLAMAAALDKAVGLMDVEIQREEVALNPDGPFRHPKARRRSGA